jgi:hypothetical protein
MSWKCLEKKLFLDFHDQFTYLIMDRRLNSRDFRLDDRAITDSNLEMMSLILSGSGSH